MADIPPNQSERRPSFCLSVLLHSFQQLPLLGAHFLGSIQGNLKSSGVIAAIYCSNLPEKIKKEGNIPVMLLMLVASGLHGLQSPP